MPKIPAPSPQIFVLLAICLFTPLLIVTWINLNNQQKLVRNMSELSERFANAIDLAIKSDRDLYQAHAASQSILLIYDNGLGDVTDEWQTFYQQASLALQRMNQARAMLYKVPLVEQEMATFESDFLLWMTSAQKMLTLVETGNLAEARQFNLQVVSVRFTRLRRHFDVMGELARNLSEQSLKD